MSAKVQNFYIWDNTPNGSVETINDLHINRNGNNIGLSRAYNYALQYANQNGFDYLLTLDQDSRWENFPYYIQLVQDYESKKGNGKVVYFASTSPNDTAYTKIAFGGINSGAIIPTSLLNQTSWGGYNTDFFMDGIDDWLQLEAARNNYINLRIGKQQLFQKFGEGCIGRFLWKRIESPNRSPMRLYGVFRNYMILWRDYELPKEMKIKTIKDWLFRWTKNIILIENNKYLKLKAIAFGLYDGILKRPSRIKKFI